MSNRSPRPIGIVPLFPLAGILIVWLSEEVFYRQHLGGILYPIAILGCLVAVGVYASHPERSARLLFAMAFACAFVVAIGGLFALLYVAAQHNAI